MGNHIIPTSFPLLKYLYSPYLIPLLHLCQITLLWWVKTKIWVVSPQKSVLIQGWFLQWNTTLCLIHQIKIGNGLQRLLWKGLIIPFNLFFTMVNKVLLLRQDLPSSALLKFLSEYTKINYQNIQPLPLFTPIYNFTIHSVSSGWGDPNLHCDF